MLSGCFLGFQRSNIPLISGCWWALHCGLWGQLGGELRAHSRIPFCVRMNEPSETFAGLYQLVPWHIFQKVPEASNRACRREETSLSPIHEDAPFGDSTYVKLSSSVCPQPSLRSQRMQGGESSHQPGWILCGTLTNFTGNELENITSLHERWGVPFGDTHHN